MCFLPLMFHNLCSIVTIFIDPHTFYFLHVMFFCFVHVIESCCDGCQKGCKHLKTLILWIDHIQLNCIIFAWITIRWLGILTLVGTTFLCSSHKWNLMQDQYPWSSLFFNISCDLYPFVSLKLFFKYVTQCTSL